MMHKTSSIGQLFGVVLLVLTLFAPCVHADEYAAVNGLLRDGRLSEAMVSADQYLEKNPRDPQMRFLRGLIQQDSGDLEAAIVTYTSLMQDYPELPEPYNNVAVIYAGQAQFTKARDALEMATRNSRSYATAHENLGDVYARLANEAYTQAVQMDAGNKTLAPKLALIRQLINFPASSRKAPFPGPITPAPAPRN